MISYNKKIKLLVFPSYISIINDIKILIINKIKQNNININKISSESSFLVLDVSDFVAA